MYEETEKRKNREFPAVPVRMREQRRSAPSSLDCEGRCSRRERSSTSEESLAPRDHYSDETYFVENELYQDDDDDDEQSEVNDSDFDYMDNSDYYTGGVLQCRQAEVQPLMANSLGVSPVTTPPHITSSSSPWGPSVPPLPRLPAPMSDDTSGESDFEDLEGAVGGEDPRRSILEDYSEPTPTRTTSCTPNHVYDPVYIPRSAINNFVDSANYVKGRKRSDSVQTNPYEEIGIPGGAERGFFTLPIRGTPIYATVDEARMDAAGLLIFSPHSSCMSDSSVEVDAATYPGPLLPTRRPNSYRGPPLLLSRRRRRRPHSLPPRNRRDILPALPDRPSTPPPRGKPVVSPDQSFLDQLVPDYETARAADLREMATHNVDLDSFVPLSIEDLTVSDVPPALPERTVTPQQPPLRSRSLGLGNRPLPRPEERPLRDRTSTTTRTIDLDRIQTYDVDLDSIVPPSSPDKLEDTLAPLVWLPEPRYSGLTDDDDSGHQYTSLETMAASLSIDVSSPPMSPESHSDFSGGKVSPIYSVVAHRQHETVYDTVYIPPKDPIYEPVGVSSSDPELDTNA